MTSTSVILPYYKKENFIKKTVLSILNQTHKNFELIIIDDENSKQSNKVLKEIKKINKKILVIKKEEILTYDQSLSVAKYRAKKKKQQIFKRDAHLNNLTAQIKLQSDLINKAQLLRYAVIRKGKIKLLNYTIMGEEFLKTELGVISTIKLKRIRQTSNRETFLWFAPQWNYLLVKLEQKEKGGENYTMLLREGSLNHINLMK